VLQEQPNLRLLVVGLTRPTLFERRPGWGDGPMQHTRLDLHPLSEQNSRRLVGEILHKAPVIPRVLEDLIVSRVGGNPFYIEELIKMLIEDDVIVTGEDQWHIELDRLEAARVPATLTGVLQARLDGLPPTEREELQHAAVVGRVFWSNVVERMHNPDTAAIKTPSATGEHLTLLKGKELIFERPKPTFAGTHEYIFKHAILHDVTYESVLKRLRRAYHAQVAQCLIELSGERAGEYAGRIGEHYERSEMASQAADWYARAGNQAQDTYAPEAAISYYQKALALWNVAPNAAPTTQRLEAYEGLGEMLTIQARYAEATETFTAMRAVAEAIGNAQALARAWYGLSTIQSNQGDHRAALDLAYQAEIVADAANARSELALVFLMKGRSMFMLGNVEAARALSEQMLVLMSDIGDQRGVVRSLNLLGMAHNALGHHQQAEQCLERATTICQALGDRRQMEDLLNNLGVQAQSRGDYRAAFERFQEALKIAREIGDREGEMVFLSNLGEAHLKLGEFQAAEDNLRQAIQMAGAAGLGGLPDTFAFLAEACLGQGKGMEALDGARRALALSQEEGAPEYISAAWRTLGEVAAHLHELIVIDQTAAERHPYDAPACFAESLRICDETGMPGERARTLRAWAHYEIAMGDQAHGMAMWQEARAIFAELGADLEVERMGAMPGAREA
jgi:tetratricopeptide (TPR) repeat protein